MTFSPRLLSTSRSFFLFPALFLLGHAATACKEDEQRPAPQPSGSGGRGNGDGDGDGDGDTGGDSGLGGEGNTETGGSGMGGTGGIIEGTPCEEIECHPLAVCDDSTGTAECICPEGLDGDECADIDECLDPSACEPGTACINIHGGFLCRCYEGQVDTGSGCVDIQECDAEPCDENATCTDSVDSFTCACNDGYFGNGFTCSDTDNCTGNPCGSGNICLNTPSGYVCQCAAGSGGASDCSTECSELDFADPTLEAAVRTAINKPSGTITQADIANTSTLYLSGEDIVDLSGLECWGHLEYIDLNNTRLGEMPATYPNAFAALSDLTRLRELYLGCTAISSLDMLAEHPTLERLSVGRFESCQADSINLAALSSLKSLRWLDISGLGQSDLDSLTDLKALQYLAASNNSISSVDALDGLRGLKTLLLDGNQISDVNPLSNLSLLEELDLEANEIASIDSLTGLNALFSLSVGDNQLESLPNIGSFGALTFFDARNNEIDTLTGVASLGPMMWVGLAGNQIASLDAIVGTSLSGTVSVRDNPIDCEDEGDNILALSGQGVNLISDCTD